VEPIITSILTGIVGILLDPVVLLGVAVVLPLLLTGVAARLVEALQDVRPRGRRRDQAGVIRVNGNS
jgi:hypothetical protein